jgi:cytochrome P450
MNSLHYCNSRAILHDKSTYGEDTDDFRPERFMNGESLNPDVPLPEEAFGFGRRLCPGSESAKATLWIAIASLLAVFDLKGEGGKKEQDYGNYKEGFVQ